MRPQGFLASLVSEAMSDCARGALWDRPTVVSGERRGRRSGQGSEWLEARHAPVRCEESAHPGGREPTRSPIVDMPPSVGVRTHSSVNGLVD